MYLRMIYQISVFMQDRSIIDFVFRVAYII